jgi:hypothetical protein
MGAPTSNYGTAGIALMVSGALKSHHHDKVETPSVGHFYIITEFSCRTLMLTSLNNGVPNLEATAITDPTEYVPPLLFTWLLSQIPKRRVLFGILDEVAKPETDAHEAPYLSCKILTLRRAPPMSASLQLLSAN